MTLDTCKHPTYIQENERRRSQSLRKAKTVLRGTRVLPDSGSEGRVHMTKPTPFLNFLYLASSKTLTFYALQHSSVVANQCSYTKNRHSKCYASPLSSLFGHICLSPGFGSSRCETACHSQMHLLHAEFSKSDTFLRTGMRSAT